MKFLFGTAAYNQHVQHLALALYEAGVLGAYYSTGVDHYRLASANAVRRFLAAVTPALDRQLQRRRIVTVPAEVVHADWLWELPRTVAARVRADARIQDWLWERSEYRLAGRCARRLRAGDCDGFWGIEHGALAALRTAQQGGKKTVLSFLSPHHTMKEQWVDREYEKFPELLTPATQTLLRLAKARDARRDAEAALADTINTNSRLVRNSLIAAGFPQEKIFAVPLGSPLALPDSALPATCSLPLRVLYAGPVSVRKGGHYLLQAWRALAPGGTAELHCYGINLLPEHLTRTLGREVVWHGSVPQEELFLAYQQAAVLVFPTLCDGFGGVVTEAFANGLPVITTRNAGAADLIEEGRNGFVVPAGDAEALGERLAWCLSHPHELLQMKRNALATARRWTWRHFRVSLRRQLSGMLRLPPLTFAEEGEGEESAEFSTPPLVS